jgi:2,3,4,5-tetrahydropyridine-2-carboxylate N-succinyltransferase
MTQLFAFGLGLPTLNARGAPLDVYFPAPLKTPDADCSAALAGEVSGKVSEVGPEAALRIADILHGAGSTDAAASTRRLAEADAPLVAVALENDEAIESTAEAYFKLHLFSHRLALPNTLNLDGIFAQLPNVVWSSAGPIDPAEIETTFLRARVSGVHLTVHSLDKFPRMTDYVIPSGVRIADASRIRLGAYLGDGTTVMHEGFVNFNAAALGPNMVEGRISQGVVLGAHSDLGGGSSTMGTLSGGGEITITIGENCLVGANGGTGIPLGDRCTIEAGLYITAGTVVELVAKGGGDVMTVKARELAGQSDLLFIRNSRTGKVECRTNRSAIELNTQLHSHN